MDGSLEFLFVSHILIIWSSRLHLQVYRFAPKPSAVCILHTVVMLVKATASVWIRSEAIDCILTYSCTVGQGYCFVE